MKQEVKTSLRHEKKEFSVNAPTGRGEETIREMRDALPADATRTAHR